MLFCLIFLVAVFLVLQISFVQNKIKDYAVNQFSEKFESKLEIKNLEISFFEGIILEGFFLQDLQKDTLIYINKFKIIPDGLITSFDDIILNKIELNGLIFKLYEPEADLMNMQFLIDAFSSSSPEQNPDTSSQDFHFRCNKFELNNASFLYKIYNPDTISGINYDDLKISKFNISISDLDVFNENTKFKIDSISFKDKSGTEIKKLSTTKSSINSQGIILDNPEIIMANSELYLDSLYFKYQNWDSFSNFTDDVYLGLNFRDTSKISLKDLAYFVPEISGLKQQIFLNGSLSGTINKLNINDLVLNYPNILNLKMNSKLNNLTDLEKLNFNIDIKKLQANIVKLKNIKLSDSSQIFELPENLKNIAEINYSGITKGSVFDFVSKGKLNGNFGKITVDIIGNRDSLTIFGAKGLLKAENLDLKNSLGNEFGKLTFRQNFDFKYFTDEKMKFKTTGIIDSFTYKNFTYKNIRLYADMYDLKFDSLSLHLNQEEINAKLDGILDFKSETPEFIFDLMLEKADLKKMNLETNTKKSFLSFAVKGDLKVSNIDDFYGNIKLYEEFIYQNDSINFRLKKFDLNTDISGKNKELKKININSDFIDAEIVSSGKLSNIIESANELTSKFLPAFIPEKEKNNIEKTEITDSLAFVVELKNIKKISRIIIPEIDIANEIEFEGNYNTENNYLFLESESGHIHYNDIKIIDFYIIANTKNDSLHIKTGGSTLQPTEDIKFDNFDISSVIKNNNIDFDISWNSYKDTSKYSGEIRGLLNIAVEENKNSPLINCKFHKSEITLADSVWNFADSEIIIDSTFIGIRNLIIKNNEQEILIDGNISEYEGDILTAEFKDFNLISLLPLTEGEPNLEGILNGKIRLVQLYTKPLFFTKDTIKSMRVSNIPLGDLYFKSEWENDDNKIAISMFVLTGKKKVMTDTIGGYYWPDKDSISMTTELKGFRVKAFEDFYKENIKTNDESQLWGKINATGYLKNPQITGDIRLTNTLLNILYLNTKYSINKSMNINIKNNEIVIKETKLFSDSKRRGYALVSGNIKHNNFDNFNLDIFVDAHNFQFINTMPTDSSAFYGTAYGTGNINVLGPVDDMKIDINLKTEKRTAFYLPLSSSGDLSEETDFISYAADSVFVSEERNTFEEEYETDVSGMKLNLNLELTPEAEIQLIMDASSGDIIKARGRGDMEIGIDTRSDFTMFGDFTITKGDYLFTLKSIMSKHFKIKKGGTIRWYGDPENAIINLNAVYSLKKVLLYDLMVEDKFRTLKAPVDCNISMSGKLMNPDIGFGVTMPAGFESVSEQLKKLPDDGINKQFLSLLIIGTFQPLPGLSQEKVGGGGVVKTGEIITNQLNRWLSDISNDFDVGVNYQTGDQVTSDELEVALSTQLWDDRITINGNVGVGGKSKEETASENSNSVIGEVEVEVKLNKQGSVRMKVFNQSNDELDYDKGQYTQGVGFFWRREFDKLFFWIKNDKNKNDTTFQKK